jgi:hypothetical protein
MPYSRFGRMAAIGRGRVKTLTQTRDGDVGVPTRLAVPKQYLKKVFGATSNGMSRVPELQGR